MRGHESGLRFRGYQAAGSARWRPEAQFKAWLFQIARDLAFDRLRRDKRVGFVALDDGSLSAHRISVIDEGDRLRP
ncbi:MAG TPA: hypothetical protein VHK70_03555 [Burkholderiaceae bacterium]|nr:hypothetical protein [Burkholderiaceae bacterium]